MTSTNETRNLPDRALPEGTTTRILSQQEFLASEDQYRNLLKRSDADPLFMNWEWLTRWWELHQGPYQLSLEAHVVQDGNGRWLGVAPITRRRALHRGIFPGIRIEPLGNLWRENGAAISEYQTFPADRDLSGPVSRMLARSVVGTAGWSDLCLSFCPEESATWCDIGDYAHQCGYYTRANERMYSHRLDLSSGFEAFIASLSQRSRLRIYNARKRLQQAGDVRFIVADEATLEDAFRALDELHARRWGDAALIGIRGQLYSEIARQQLDQGRLALSVLALDGEPVAAALNFRSGNCEYGIQSGFRDDVEKRVSPGYLHMGYMIEKACSDGVQYFDFLAGEGKESNYKRHFRASEQAIGSVQIVRNKGIASIYRAYDTLTGSLRRSGKRRAQQESPV